MEEKKTREKTFPYFIIRHLVAVYERQPCKEGTSRAEIFEDVRSFSKNSGRHACAVFGEKDAIYAYPDGRYEISERPPVVEIINET